MTKHYVALMSVQFTHDETGERLWAEPQSSTYHGVFEGLPAEEAARLEKLGAVREATDQEVAMASVQESQTKPIELSEQALKAAAEAEEAFQASAGAAAAAPETGKGGKGGKGGKPETEEEPAI